MLSGIRFSKIKFKTPKIMPWSIEECTILYEECYVYAYTVTNA